MAIFLCLLASLALFAADFFVGGALPLWVCILPLIPVGIALVIATVAVVVVGFVSGGALLKSLKASQ